MPGLSKSLPSNASALLENSGFDLLLKGAVLCNDASLDHKEDKWTIRGDPTEAALVVVAAKRGLSPTELRIENPRVEEIPFSSERKRMTTVHQMEDGKKIAFMKGAPEIALERCRFVQARDGLKPLRDQEREDILRASEQMAQDALRVLCVAYREGINLKTIIDFALSSRATVGSVAIP